MQVEVDTLHKPLQPILKWAGGKTHELKFILPALPVSFQNYYEPFVGGGAVYMAIPARKSFINDRSEELISLYKHVAENNQTVYAHLSAILKFWDFLEKYCAGNATEFITLYHAFTLDKLTQSEVTGKLTLMVENDRVGIEKNLPQFTGSIRGFIRQLERSIASKFARMKKLEKSKGQLSDQDRISNLETAMKGAFYTYLRELYNLHRYSGDEQELQSALFLYLRNYAFSGMFRYNSQGKFNVPYGGMGYNRKNFSKKIEYIYSEEVRNHLQNTVIENGDFEAFLKKTKPTKKDFIFLDPPYDSEFSTYDDNLFEARDQKRLADYLINDCKAQWMMVIKRTPFIEKLYSAPHLKTEIFGKKYLVSFKNRNDKDVEHLMITNY